MDHIEFDFSEQADSKRPVSRPAVTESVKDTRVKVPVSWVGIGLLLLLFIYLVFQRPSVVPPSPVDPSDATVVDGDNVFGEGYLVFVREGFEVTADQEMMLRGANDFIEAKGMIGKRVYDDDQEAAQKLVATAEAKGIAPPFIAIVANKEIRRIAPWPKSYTELEESLK